MTEQPIKLIDEGAFKKALEAYEIELIRYENYHFSTKEEEQESNIESHNEGIRQAILTYLDQRNKDSDNGK